MNSASLSDVRSYQAERNPLVCSSQFRVQNARLPVGIAHAKILVHHQGRSSVVEQRPFKPKVVGPIPTAPTNISFVKNNLHLLARPNNVRQLACDRSLGGKPSKPLGRWTQLQNGLMSYCGSSGGIAIRPRCRANKTSSALLLRLNACMMWCLWNSTVLSLKFR
jgi:hypothetical protein